MKPLKLSEIAQAVGGRLNNPAKAETTICGVHFDTRQDVRGKLFVAIKGVMDGHDFIENAIADGAVCVLSEKETDATAIIVQDTMTALGELAAYYRGLFDVKIVGITGSCGKTSCKDMIASVLGERLNVVKTQGNFNNEIGMPLTIFNITDETDVAVLEMGMNHRWEIHRLSKIARPDVCVITNIGLAHIENLGSQEEIFNAKSEIMDFMNPNGQVFLHGDDEFLIRYKDRQNVTFYGHDAHNSYRPENERDEGLDGTTYTTKLKNGENFEVFVPLPGGHMVTNSLAAVAIGDYFGLDGKQIAAGLENFRPTGMRMDIFDTPSGIKVIADCYNANPTSMRAALEVLAKADGDTVAILGDMFELGEDSKQLHHDLGCDAARLCLDMIICVGVDAEAMYEGAYSQSSRGASNSQIMYFQNKDSLIEHIERIVKAGDTVLVKASRGMQFEEIVRKLSES